MDFCVAVGVGHVSEIDQGAVAAMDDAFALVAGGAREGQGGKLEQVCLEFLQGSPLLAADQNHGIRAVLTAMVDDVEL